MKKDKDLENNLEVTSSSILRELKDVNEQLELVNKEEQELEKYLHANIFNFVEAKEGLEDVFKVQEKALQIVDELDRGLLKLDRTVPLLEVRHLTKYYENQRQPAVVNTSFKVYPGDFHALVGASGSGKTTLLNCILRNDTSYQGEILFANKITSEEELKTWLPSIGVVPAQFDWDPNSTLHDLIVQKAVALEKTHLEALSYARSSLEKLNLWHLRTRKVVELGLLERRKLGLSIALINNPSLVILDEPLTGLQKHEEVELLVLLAKLQAESRGVLVLSHLIDEFSGYANMMTILSKGRVFFSGLVKSLELQNQFKFLVQTTDNQLALTLLKRINCKYRYNEISKTILVKFDGQLNLLLFQKECAAKNIIITDLKHAATSLEDLYVVLLKVGTSEAIREIYDYRATHLNRQEVE
ncbi:ABC-2 type transport system ATP-binding protein [Mycoplasmoides fastidiosum]|uniref:ABC-2 type transport system ATP-binding protein n=1 Tax=Mycoplasmoides fastidiosum TaxID=92758 RepID=A0ABU0LYX3_9BACT|nr:ABC transporter ATP-binding protein [Mycoplasmoides fastidiosum]MDQ0513884.1 ABC-2 type transport system ATP-binding protein [Mycoplasmoides fastidiosum]UUD37702.1 ABC transporter ATP-binding protein [Mycoplasmoides fastidiosum]